MTTADFKFLLTRFFIVFALSVLLLLSAFAYHYSQELDTSKSNIKVEQKALLEGKKEYIEWVIGAVVKETALLADLVGQQGIYDTEQATDFEGRNRVLGRVSKALVSMSQRKEIYDQIRYLDLEGNEVVRVNFYQGKAAVVPKDQLQNKAHRYYFQQAIKLKCHQVYVSRLDLNIENGKIEIPYKPTIRMAAPVYDELGNKRGIVVINYLADYLIDGLRLFNLNSGTNYMLIDSNGHFLFNDSNPELEFSFMFQDKQDETIYKQFPHLAERIKSTHSGQFESPHGIMTVESVGAVNTMNPYCFHNLEASNVDSTAWKLVSFTELTKRSGFEHHSSMHIILIKLSILASMILALFVAKYQLRLHQDNRRIHYLAHYDSLTDLYNRGAFRAKAGAKADTAIKQAKPLCLIYIDLDNFKAINDQYGHQAGDIALQHVANMMKRVFGQDAIMSRLGGDEFAVLVHKTNQLDLIQHYADQLLELIRQPFKLAPDVTINVSPSIGGNYCSVACCCKEKLIHLADTAMYQAKHAGKNRVVMIECVESDS